MQENCKHEWNDLNEGIIGIVCVKCGQDWTGPRATQLLFRAARVEFARLSDDLAALQKAIEEARKNSSETRPKTP